MTTSASNNDDRFWKAASLGLFGAAIAVSALTATFLGTGLPVVVEALAGALAGAIVFALAALVSWVLFAIAGLAPRRFWFFVLASIGVMLVLRGTRFRWDPTLFYTAMAMFFGAQAVLMGAFASIRGGERRSIFIVLIGLALAIDAYGIWWLARDGYDPYPVEVPAAAEAIPPLDVPDPSQPGGLEFDTFTYGSGTDERRPEFGEGVLFQTDPVDASKLLPEWKGFKARARRWYWGISIDAAPLNGRVWMPEGDGPFPLTLIVHGNHRMEDHSDKGYAYLGELLASRGIIMVSVDENYINGTWSGDFGGREMPMRGWLLLEHLRVWREWTETAGHPLEGKVALDQIGLMGHSRGGEALGIAAAFNQLDHFPDDASVRFDYGFNIRALVSVAQIDKRYIRRPELTNVNFLALQGSYDSDEASFHGLRQFRRIRFTDDAYWFKAGVYVHGGNHGQFNTDWGRHDSGRPGKWLLNTAPMISGDDQRKLAKVYISAFLEAALNGDDRYLHFLQEPRSGASWLPEDMVTLHQFDDSTFFPIADFEEDIDVTTGSLSGATIEADGLSVWREQELLFRDRLTQGTNGVFLGSDGSREGSYTIRFGVERPLLSKDSVLAFFMSTSPETVKSEDAPDDEDSGEVPPGENGNLAIEVEIEDASGAKASVRLSEIAVIVPPLRIQFLKLKELNRKRYTNVWEPSLASYAVPLSRFTGVDPTAVTAVRFRTSSGTGVIVLDEIGFRDARLAEAKAVQPELEVVDPATR